MRLKIIFLSILSSISLVSFSQRQSYIDSLQSKLTNASDSQKIGIYNGLAWANKYSNPTLAYEYATDAYDLSIHLNNTTGQAISLNRMGAAKLKLGDFSESLKLMLEAIEISERSNQQRIMATSMRQIGEVYEAQGNEPEAMKYYYKSLSIADSINRPVGIARSALKVAGLYIKIKKYYNADQYLTYCIEEFEKENFLRGLHQAYVIKGDYYLNQDKLDSAILNYDKAIAYLETLRDRHGYATTISKISKIQELKGLFKKAINGYNNALDTFKIIEDKKGVTLTYIALAQTYRSSNNNLRSIYFGELALNKAKEWRLTNEEKEANFVLYSTYKLLNKQVKAISYLENYIYLLDSLKHGQESWRVEQMRKSYDLEIQVKENKLNTAIINNQALIIKNNGLLRNFLIVIISAIAVLAIIIWYAFKSVKTANAQLLIANEEKNEAISLISHDLKSPFNKLKGLIHILGIQLENPNDEIKDLLSKTDSVIYDGLGLVQNLVDIKALKSGSYRVKLTSFDLCYFLNQRVQGFEQLANSKNITISFTPLKNSCLVYSDMNSIARIFDNVLSNAIKFSPKKDVINIECAISETAFSFSISDNGKGIDQKEIDQIFSMYKTGNATPTGSEISSGLGLAITSSLVHKLKGSINCISKIGEGASFIISLPLKKEAIS